MPALGVDGMLGPFAFLYRVPGLLISDAMYVDGSAHYYRIERGPMSGRHRKNAACQRIF